MLGAACWLFDYCRPDDQLNTVRMVPIVSLPNVFELSYYANALLPIFATESVLGKNKNIAFSD